MKRYLTFLGILTVLELLLFLVPLFRPSVLQGLAASIPSTALILTPLYLMRRRLAKPVIGNVVCIAGAWIMMLLTAVLLAAMGPDPLAAQRIAAKGWATYVLTDKIGPGLFRGLLFGSIVYVWIWAPVGALTAVLLRRAVRADDRATGTDLETTD